VKVASFGLISCCNKVGRRTLNRLRTEEKQLKQPTFSSSEQRAWGAAAVIRALEVNVATRFEHEFRVYLEVLPAANICLTRMKVRAPSRRCGP
jgi:hypothetical protein